MESWTFLHHTPCANSIVKKLYSEFLLNWFENDKHTNYF